MEIVLAAPSCNDDMRALPSFENSANPKAFAASEDGAGSCWVGIPRKKKAIGAQQLNTLMFFFNGGGWAGNRVFSIRMILMIFN